MVCTEVIEEGIEEMGEYQLPETYPTNKKFLLPIKYRLELVKDDKGNIDWFE